MPDPSLWTVAIAVPAGHVEAIGEGAPKALAAERHRVLTEDPPDGDGATELAVDVAAATREEAIAGATRLYLKAAIAGGVDYRSVDAGDVGVIGVRGPVSQDPVDALMAEARGLLERGAHDWAVVRASTACELCAKAALPGTFRARFAGQRADAAERVCRTLNDRRQRDILLAATGATPTTEPWWEDYAALIQRRNAVVHEGFSVTPEDAARSVDAAEQCLAWLRRLWSGDDGDG